MEKTSALKMPHSCGEAYLPVFYLTLHSSLALAFPAAAECCFFTLSLVLCAASSKPMFLHGYTLPTFRFAAHGVTEMQPLRGYAKRDSLFI